MSTYNRDFDKTKFMFFFIKDDKFFQKHNDIWEKISNIMKKEIIIIMIIIIIIMIMMMITIITIIVNLYKIKNIQKLKKLTTKEGFLMFLCKKQATLSAVIPKCQKCRENFFKEI